MDKKLIDLAFQKFQEFLSTEIGKIGGTLLKAFFAMVKSNAEHMREIESVATLIGVTTAKLMILQYCYELVSACTSVVVNSGKSTGEVPYCARNMDWEFEWLSPLTIQLDVIKQNKLLYKSTTWVGYCSVLTAVKPNAFGLQSRVKNGLYFFLIQFKKRCMCELQGN